MKKILFTIASCIAGTVIFIACSCEESLYAYEENSHNTRALQKEETINKRLNEIGEEYGIKIVLTNKRAIHQSPETFLYNLECYLEQCTSLKTRSNNLPNDTIEIILYDDDILNDISIATTSATTILEGTVYSGSFNRNHQENGSDYPYTIHWYFNTLGSYNIYAEYNGPVANTYTEIRKITDITAPYNKPCFNYSGVMFTTKDSNIIVTDTIVDGENIKYIFRDSTVLFDSYFPFSGRCINGK